MLRLFALCLIVLFAGPVVDQRSSPPPSPPVPKAEDLEKLRLIGLKIIGAVMTEDTAVLLEIDRPDLRSRDSRALADPSSQLSCFLFNEKCVFPKGSKTIRQRLAGTRRLRVMVDMPPNQKSDTISAALVFYDGKKGAVAPEKVCDSPQLLETWSFEWSGSEWVSARPMFDSETEGWCGYEPTV